jgi:hypothetical protein
MPMRSNDEIAADWFRIIAKHMIEVIESTQNCNASTEPPPLATDAYITYLIRTLADQCPAEKDDKIATVPCCIEVLIDSYDSGEIWERQEELLDDNDELILYPQGIRRLWLDKAWEQNTYSIDALGATWFYFSNTGAGIIKVLTKWLNKPWSNLNHRTRASNNDLLQLDYDRLYEDLILADRCYRGFIESPEDQQLRSELGDVIDRLWRRLNDGHINLIDAPEQTRIWLKSFWDDILWVQRWVEWTSVSPNDFYEAGRQPAFVYQPALINFNIHLEVCNWYRESMIAAERETRGFESEPSKGRNATANQLMMEVIIDRRGEVIEWSKATWASEIGKGETTIQKTDAWEMIQKWRVMNIPKEYSRDEVPELVPIDSKGDH